MDRLILSIEMIGNPYIIQDGKVLEKPDILESSSHSQTDLVRLEFSIFRVRRFDYYNPPLVGL